MLLVDLKFEFGVMAYKIRKAKMEITSAFLDVGICTPQTRYVGFGSKQAELTT